MKFLEAVLILSGMIMGVGMFAIPFSFAQAGFWLGMLELAVLTAVVVAIHLLYGEIALSTGEKHRLLGYVQKYLGNHASYLASFSAFFGIGGTLLAYLVLGSFFLNTIAHVFWSGSSEILWAFGIAVAGGLYSLISYRREALINGILTIFLILFIAVLVFLLFFVRGINTSYLTGFHVQRIFFPYGILLFALTGGTVIPDMIAVLGRRRRQVRLAILTGTILPAVVYALFAAAVVGVSGSTTSPEAIKGLARLLGEPMLYLGSIIGFFAVITSYIVLNSSFQALLSLDIKMHRLSAWIVGTAGPLALYLAGFQNFIAVIGVVGVMSVGIDAALIMAIYRRITERTSNLYSHAAKFGLIYAMVAVGIVHQLYIFFFAG